MNPRVLAEVLLKLSITSPFCVTDGDFKGPASVVFVYFLEGASPQTRLEMRKSAHASDNEVETPFMIE